MVTATIHKDFPKKGVNFVDFSPFLADIEQTREMIFAAMKLHDKYKFTQVVGIESRGFILGGMIALALNLPFIMIRKKGKLPGKVLSASYDLEYGSATIEMQEQELGNVLLVDDVFATGGTITAAKALCEANKAKNVLGFCLFDIGITEVPYWLATLYNTSKMDIPSYSTEN